MRHPQAQSSLALHADDDLGGGPMLHGTGGSLLCMVAFVLACADMFLYVWCTMFAGIAEVALPMEFKVKNIEVLDLGLEQATTWHVLHDFFAMLLFGRKRSAHDHSFWPHDVTTGHQRVWTRTTGIVCVRRAPSRCMERTSRVLNPLIRLLSVAAHHNTAAP